MQFSMEEIKTTKAVIQVNQTTVEFGPRSQFKPGLPNSSKQNQSLEQLHLKTKMI